MASMERCFFGPTTTQKKYPVVENLRVRAGATCTPTILNTHTRKIHTHSKTTPRLILFLSKRILVQTGWFDKNETKPLPRVGDNYGDVAWVKSVSYYGNDDLSLKSTAADNWTCLITDYDPTTTPPKRKRRKAASSQISRSQRFDDVLILLKKAGVAMKKKRKSQTPPANVTAAAGAVASTVETAAAAVTAVAPAAGTAETNDAANDAAGVATTTTPDVSEVMSLIESHNSDGLCNMGVAVYDNLPEPASPLDGWGPQMPPWEGQGGPRGLLGWGETRKGGKEGDKKGKIYQKNGAIVVLCAKPLFDSVDKWLRKFGTPPVIAGNRMYIHNVYIIVAQCIYPMYI